MTNRMQADQAKYGLSGKTIVGQNRPIRVKLASQGTSVEVKNLSPLISNERLFDAFSRFGKIERAVVMVDERGKSLEKYVKCLLACSFISIPFICYLKLLNGIFDLFSEYLFRILSFFIAFF